jgi:hypothetical protein
MTARLTSDPAIKAGDRFGRLVAVEFTRTANNKPGWQCVCDCGASSVATRYNLLNGNTTSCGCFYAENMRAGLRRTHGEAQGDGTSEFIIWSGIIQRCESPTAQAYARYGGRGIRVCEEWRGPDGFARFVADVGRRPSPDHSIDRIDNDGNYEPGNVRWATRQEQAENRRSSRKLTHAGETLTITEWARRTGLSQSGIARRLDAGWTVERALTQPSRLGAAS